jgi:hypothetical protein
MSLLQSTSSHKKYVRNDKPVLLQTRNCCTKLTIARVDEESRLLLRQLSKKIVALNLLMKGLLGTSELMLLPILHSVWFIYTQ